MQNDDFVEIEFTGTVEGSNEVFDTTDKAVADANKIPLSKPGPALVIVGSPMVVPGVTAQLRQMSVGEEREFTVPAEQAFGPRRGDAIKVISLAKFMREKVMPAPGEVLEIDGARAKVLSVSGGRVRADFNHPLAGKSLRYRVKVIRQLTDPLEKARALLGSYGLEADAALADGALTITPAKPLPPVLEQLLRQKLTAHVKELKSVAFAAQKKGGEVPAGEKLVETSEKPAENRTENA